MANGRLFQKGNKGKPKGAKNKVTKVSQEALANALDGCADDIRVALSKLKGDPVNYLNAIAKILPFVVAKKADIDVTSKGETVRSFEILPASETANKNK